MNAAILYKDLFGDEEEITGSQHFLQGIAEKYPYFSAAHYFLLRTAKKNDSAYNKIAGMAALHFNNPFLLNFRLNEIDSEPPLREINRLDDAQKVNNDGEMLFEPLFATDYFASQGIKLGEELQPADKLGKQLRSFTEWLRTMKKVHEGGLPPGNEQVDITVQKLAEKSNQEADVLTESMAEAYLQQGKTRKAIEIFEKLSLFNPSKSAYFAAKIDRIATAK